MANNNKSGVIKCFQAEGEQDGEGDDTEVKALAFGAKILDANEEQPDLGVEPGRPPQRCLHLYLVGIIKHVSS